MPCLVALLVLCCASRARQSSRRVASLTRTETGATLSRKGAKAHKWPHNTQIGAWTGLLKTSARHLDLVPHDAPPAARARVHPAALAARLSRMARAPDVSCGAAPLLAVLALVVLAQGAGAAPFYTACPAAAQVRAGGRAMMANRIVSQPVQRARGSLSLKSLLTVQLAVQTSASGTVQLVATSNCTLTIIPSATPVSLTITSTDIDARCGLLGRRPARQVRNDPTRRSTRPTSWPSHTQVHGRGGVRPHGRRAGLHGRAGSHPARRALRRVRRPLQGAPLPWGLARPPTLHHRDPSPPLHRCCRRACSS